MPLAGVIGTVALSVAIVLPLQTPRNVLAIEPGHALTAGEKDLTTFDIGGFQLGGDITASIQRFSYLEVDSYSMERRQRTSAILRRANQDVDPKPDLIREYRGNLQETRPEGRVNIVVHAAGNGKIHKITYTLKGTDMNLGDLEKEWVSKFGPPTKKDGDKRYWNCVVGGRGSGLDLVNDCVLLELNSYVTEVRASDERIFLQWTREYEARIAAGAGQ